jgi:hypothetical protein
MARPGARSATIIVVVVAALIGLAFAGRALWDVAKSHFATENCSVGKGYSVDTGQASVAAQMVGAVTSFPVKLPARASMLVLAAGLQESKLTNLAPGDGDRDSVGVLQQRPSQGWGHGQAAVLENVSEATKEFLEHLIDVPHWTTLAPAVAIQDVQVSADGSLYAKQVPEAQALADALTGQTPAGITCTFDAPTKVAAPSVVAEQASTQLGITTPRAEGTLTVRVAGAHWQTAAWFVANGDLLGIEHVAYAGKEWTRSAGWKPASTATSAAVVATLYQRT